MFTLAQSLPVIMSTSEHWRIKGNEVVSAADQTGSFTEWEAKMKEAVDLYRKALTTALDDDDKASAAKNMGIVSLQMANRYTTESKEHGREALEMYKQAIKSFCSAHDRGKSAKSTAWVENVQAKIQKAMDDANDMARREPLGKPRIYVLQSLLSVIPDGNYKIKLQLEVISTELKNAVIAFDTDDYKSGLGCLKNCDQPIDELTSTTCTLSDEEKESLKQLSHEIDKQRKIGHSIQARSMGKVKLIILLNVIYYIRKI